MSSIHTLYAFSFRLCFPNSSPQFKPLNAIPLRRTKHYNNNNNNVKFPRERTRTRATLDDVETDQLSSTPLGENDKAKKVPSYPLGFPLMLQALVFCLIS